MEENISQTGFGYYKVAAVTFQVALGNVQENAKTIIRHWDVNGKNCPAPMVGKDNEKWVLFYTFITKGYSMKAKVIKKAAIRSSGKVTPTNEIMTMDVGSIVTIEKIVGNWGRLKYKDAKGRYQWISLNKVKEI